MTMKRIELDISSDIFDKVISFLSILPKNKIKITTHTLEKDNNHFNPKEFFGSANSSKAEIDKYLDENKNEWNNYIDGK